MTGPGDTGLGDIDLTDYDLYRQGFPHDVFTRLRRDVPVWKHPETEMLREAGVAPFWVLSRHEDLRRVNRDTVTFTAFDGAQIRDTSPERKGKMLISMDGKPHSRLRRLVSHGFTPRMLDTLESHLRWRTNRILDSIEGRAGIDFVGEVAELLPLHVIADIIGIPEDERPDVFKGTNTILRAFDPEGGVGLEQRLETERKLFAYATSFNEAKRRAPVEDIWSVLVQAEVVDDDGTPTRLSNHELDLFFFLLAAAGSETTRNAISYGMLAFVRTPRAVGTTPGRSRSHRSGCQRDPPVELTGVVLPPNRDNRRRGEGQLHPRPATSSRSGTRRPTGTRTSSPNRSASTWGGRRTTRWRSVEGVRTTVSARPWPGGRSASCSSHSWIGSRRWR